MLSGEGVCPDAYATGTGAGRRTGPAGLTSAIALARQGVPTLLVERRRDLSKLPRATVVSTRSMEIFRSWGLEDRMHAGGVDVEWLLWMCETVAGAVAGSAHAVGYPTRDQSAVLSPTGPACVPQDHLEPVLLAHLCIYGVDPECHIAGFRIALMRRRYRTPAPLARPSSTARTATPAKRIVMPRRVRNLRAR